MPYKEFVEPCKKCAKENQSYRIKNHKNGRQTREYTCISCERAKIKKHQQENREYWRELNKKCYQNWSKEFKEKRLLQSHARHKRLKAVKWEQELTDFVTEEAHLLRRLRDSLFSFRWHVDHVIPLNGRSVSGLHVWNNLRVIPAMENLSKHNKVAEGGL